MPQLSTIPAKSTAVAGTDRIPRVDGDYLTADQIAGLGRVPVIVSTITSNTITPTGTTDIVRGFSLSAGLTIANPSTTPADGWGMKVELKDNGTARALTWGSKYAAGTSALPTTTVAGKRHALVFFYNTTDDKLYCDGAVVQA